MNAAERTLARWGRTVILRVRLRRALVAASAVATAACAVGSLPPAARWLGFQTPWWLNGTELALAASVMVFLAILVAALVPVSTVHAVSRADRRSQLDGALVAAVESIGTDEPIGRLLVRRTARQVGTLAKGRAVPLAGPGATAASASVALLFLAAVLPAAGTSAGGENVAAGDGPEAVLSARLREVAATIVRDVDIPAADRSALARRVLDVEAGLLGGTLSSEDAGLALESMSDRLGERHPGPATARPAAVTPAGAATVGGLDGGGRARADASAEPRSSGAPGVAGGTGGGGPGAGRRGSGLGVAPDVNRAEGPMVAAAEWTLPRAPEAETPARAGTGRPGGGGDPGATVDVVSAGLRPVEQLLTREERVMVEAYMDRLRRLTRDDPATTRR